MFRSITSCTLVCFVASVSQAANPKDERVTITYDVAHLLHESSGKTGFDSLDDVIKSIVTSVNPKSWLPAPDGVNRIFEVNGTKLEILATKAEHDDIKEILEAHRRINDLAVDVRATFLAIDPKLFLKGIEPRLGKQFPVDGDDDDFLRNFKEQADTIQTCKRRFANGREATLAEALREAFSFAKPVVGKIGQVEWQAELIGVSYRCQATVSADRRFVTLKIDEVFRELSGNKKDDAVPPIKEKKTITQVRLPDGSGTILLVPHVPKTIKDRKRILLLLIQPEIFIEAEEKERRGDKIKG